MSSQLRGPHSLPPPPRAGTREAAPPAPPPSVPEPAETPASLGVAGGTGRSVSRVLLCLSCLPRQHLITGVTGQGGGGATLHLQARPLVGGQFHGDVRRAPTAFSGDRGQGQSRLCVRPPVSPGAAEGPGRQGQGAPMGLASQARMCFKGTRTEVAASARVTHPGPRKGTQTEPAAERDRAAESSL